MKKKSSSQSAFFNVRVLIAAFLCLAAIAVALFGMGAFSTAFAQKNNQSPSNQDAPGSQTPDVIRMVGPVRLDQDLRTLPYVAPKAEFEESAVASSAAGTATSNGVRHFRIGVRPGVTQKYFPASADDAAPATDV